MGVRQVPGRQVPWPCFFFLAVSSLTLTTDALEIALYCVEMAIFHTQANHKVISVYSRMWQTNTQMMKSTTAITNKNFLTFRAKMFTETNQIWWTDVTSRDASSSLGGRILRALFLKIWPRYGRSPCTVGPLPTLHIYTYINAQISIYISIRRATHQ